ncbi:hypothetical protein O181_028921 [Austropuccinia psidii MF-1]|uniref:Glycosyltransferase family 32 protein n=1 Tax=Austropuccinia psidii MF-1 TaxID=1389203 RepID=A0A9Q3H2U9_9BASI|nr:hypothetical protein [Austropuccinia psidii MF-1]
MGKLPTPRRLWILLIVMIIFIVTFWKHILLLSRILLVYPLWWSSSANLSLSFTRDGFDASFEKYPVEQWSTHWPPRLANGTWPPPQSSLLRLKDGSLARLPDERYGSVVSYSEPQETDLVPPILHHILLGMNRQTMPKSWQASRNSCLALHPESANFTHYFWDDHSAEKFMRQHYSFFVRDFLDYRHTIQRADALRYFVLHHFGGIFLDLDLECRRSLGPLRRFPIVNINASPVGVSNGFMMAQAGHPFLDQLTRNLKYYDRSWLGIPYADIMFSTGPMFLSSEHLRFPASQRYTQLRVLGQVEHRLNGRVVTPLFRHLGASSWHQGDANLFLKIRQVLNQPLVTFALFCIFLSLSAGWIWKRRITRNTQHLNLSSRTTPLDGRYLLTGRLVLRRFGFGRQFNHYPGDRYERIDQENLQNSPYSSTSDQGHIKVELDSFDCHHPKLFNHKHSVLETASSSSSSQSESDDDGSENAVVVLIDHANWVPCNKTK